MKTPFSIILVASLGGLCNAGGFLYGNPNDQFINVYVDKGFPYGHVFIGLQDEGVEYRYGFYPKPENRGLRAGFGTEGEVRNDGSTAFDVGRSFHVSEQQYASAMAVVRSWAQTPGAKYAAVGGDHQHCGDFVDRIMQQAGLGRMTPPSNWVMRTYPSAWSLYLNSLAGPVQGCVQLTSGATYNGEFTGGEMTGRGTMAFPDGSVRWGRFQGGFQDGPGCYKTPQGHTWEGVWTRGSLTGVATLFEAGGHIFRGPITDGRFNGVVETWQKGSYYQQQYASGNYGGPAQRTPSPGVGNNGNAGRTAREPIDRPGPGDRPARRQEEPTSGFRVDYKPPGGEWRNVHNDPKGGLDITAKEKPDRPTKEKPEKPDKPDKPERPERPIREPRVGRD